MMPPQIKPTGTSRADNKHTCDLLIYDEESDKHVRISWEDAMNACCVEDPGVAADATKIPRATAIARGTATTGPQTAGDWYTAAAAINRFNKGENDFTDILNHLDVRIVLARPFIEHLMHSAILCVAGRDTGATRTSRPLEPRTRHTLSLATHTRRLARAQSSARRTCSSRQTPR